MLQITPSTTSRFGTDAKAVITERVRGEFREMPGLSLTLAQAGRLWSLDDETCRDVLTQLVENGFLCRRPDGAFCRSSDLRGRRVYKARTGLRT